MQLFCHVAALRHGVKQPLRSVLRVAGHEAEQVIPRHFVQPPQKPGKIQTQPQILAVRVHILPQKGDIFIARRNQFAKLVFNGFRVAAALPSSHIGYNTVGAEIVAAVHNGQPRARTLAAQDRQSLGDFAPFVTGNVKNPLFPGQRAEQQLRKAPKRMGSEHQINVRIAFFDLFRNLFLLHHAAA